MQNQDWYQQLRKSSLNPPPQVFGPVWGVLYATLAVSLLLYWRARPTRLGLALFFGQLVLNLSWSPIFFGAMQPCTALLVIVLMVGLTAATLVEFHKRSRLATWLLVPYLAWISFATYLNGVVCALN